MKRSLQDAYIVAATRAPIAKAPQGDLRYTRPDDLLAMVLQAVLARVPGLDPAAIEDVIVGCAIPEAQQGLNVARIAALLAGLPVSVGGATVNRFCASGLTALAMAADRIRVGESDVMIAAGVESMSMVPIMGNTPSLSPAIFEQDDHIGIAYGMGLTAEKVAQKWQVSREDQDQFALGSHRKALAAQAAGAFNDEICALEIPAYRPDFSRCEVTVKTHRFSQDAGPRADTTLAALAKLKPVFAMGGSVTAGNSSQMSDGAGALILASESAVKRFNLTPLARFVSFAVRGVPPEYMGIGPITAIPAALAAAGIKQDDLDWIELNEAFAAQSLAVLRELHLDPEKTNPLGGAIALGHPLGATGAIRAATVVHGLRRQAGKYGMVTMCVGTGMGAAGIIERL
ncbi:MAG: acetyl-CoA C-acyltransferase [Ottowia sp.]|nr:acetyl-CoA C-acyltransferase [Ottowia sp.]